MTQIRWLIRASRLARRPPSARRVVFLLVVIGVSLGIAGIEMLFGWPDWLTPGSLRLKP